MPTATKVIDSVEGFAGPAHCYQLSEPLAGSDYVTVFAVDMPGTQHDETIIVPAFNTGAAILMTKLPGSLVGWADHEKALQLAGYDVANPEAADEAATEGL